MGTIATRKFTDDEGNALFLKVTTSKRRPFVVRALHGTPDGNKTGILDAATEQAAALEKLEALAAKASADGWREIHGRSALTEIPKPVLNGNGAARSEGGGLRVAGRRR